MLAEERLDADDPLLATVLNGLGIVYKYTGRFAEAEPLYRQALALVERTSGPDSPDAAGIHHNLGGLAHAAGRFADAEAPARRAVEIRLAALGPEHPEVAADRAALAAILDGLGRSDEAAALLAQALTVFERVLRAGPLRGRRHPAQPRGDPPAERGPRPGGVDVPARPGDQGARARP